MEKCERLIDEAMAMDCLYKHGWNLRFRCALLKALRDVADEDYCEASRCQAYSEFCGAVVFMANAGYLSGYDAEKLIDACEGIMAIANDRERENER